IIFKVIVDLRFDPFERRNITLSAPIAPSDIHMIVLVAGIVLYVRKVFFSFPKKPLNIPVSYMRDLCCISSGFLLYENIEAIFDRLEKRNLFSAWRQIICGGFRISKKVFK